MTDFNLPKPESSAESMHSATNVSGDVNLDAKRDANIGGYVAVQNSEEARI